MNTALLVGFLVALILGVPIAFSMIIAAMIAVLAKGSLDPLVVVQNLFAGIDSFALLAIPFFILAAELMSGAALTEVLLAFANQLVGRVRGGLGHTTILTLTFFSGISGSALADAAGPGSMLFRMMSKAGYAPSYAAALVAATSMIGPIIPPSIIMIVYALTETSVTIMGLFLGGVLPGLMIAGALALVNHWISVRRHYRTAFAGSTVRDVARGFVRALPALMLPVIILGGIHAGVFTPTEASAAAVFYALIVGRYVYRTLLWSMLPKLLFRTAMLTSSILVIIAASEAFSFLLTIGQIPQILAQWMASFALGPVALLLLINVFLLVAGIFIEPLPGVMIFVPILAPMAIAAGIDPLHFAIVVIVNLTLGMITPPVGAVLFVVSIVSGVSMGKMSRDLAPLLAAQIGVLLLLTFVPQLVTWLPRSFGYVR